MVGIRLEDRQVDYRNHGLVAEVLCASLEVGVKSGVVGVQSRQGSWRHPAGLRASLQLRALRLQPLRREHMLCHDSR